MKNLFLICIIQFVFGGAFAQEHDPTPEPKVSKPQKQEEVYTVGDEPAQFPGGMGALNKYLMENLRYPQMALENNISGKCYLQFVITEKGEIKNIKVKKGVRDCPECDQEAIRLLESMPKWTPAKVNGKFVNSLFNCPLNFKLT